MTGLYSTLSYFFYSISFKNLTNPFQWLCHMNISLPFALERLKIFLKVIYLDIAPASSRRYTKRRAQFRKRVIKYHLPLDVTEAPSWWLASLSSSRLLLLKDVLDWCLTLRSRGVEGGLPGGSWLGSPDWCILLDAPPRISVIMNLDLCGIVVEASPLSRPLLLFKLLFRESSPLERRSTATPFRSTMFSNRCASRPDILLRFRPLLATATPLRAATWWFCWWWTVITVGAGGSFGLRAPAGASVATPGLARYLGDRILPTMTT